MKLAFVEAGVLIGYGSKSDAFSTHYLCPECGKVWAQEIIVDGPSQHTASIVMCPLHYKDQPSRSPPVFSDETHESRFTVRTLPLEVLKRDFHYLCQLNGL